MREPRSETLKRSRRIDFITSALAVLICLSTVAAPLATVAPGASPVGTAAAAPGDKAWSFSTGSYVQSSPSFGYGNIYFGSGDENVYAVNAETGEQVWSFSTGDTIRSSAAVADGTVYIGSDDNTIYALDAETGEQQWSYSTGGPVSSGAPTVVDGVVYATHGGSSLFALDAETGEQLWSYGSVSQNPGSPTVADGLVYVGDQDSIVHAVDAETGQEVWTYSTGSNVYSEPTVAGGNVYVGSDDSNLYALDAKSGSEVWTFSTGGNVKSAPTVADGTVYVGSYDKNVYAVDAETGDQRWSYSVGASPEGITFAGDTVYVGDLGNTLHAVDAEDGAQKWTYATGNVILSHPTVVGGVAYVGSYDNSMYALETGHSASSSGSRVELGTLGMIHSPDSPDSPETTQTAGREFAWELDDETERELYSDNPELLLERPDGSTDIAEFNHNDRAFHRVENGTNYDLRVMSDTPAVYDFKDYTVQEIMNYGILRIPSFNETTNGTATPVPAASVGDLKAQIRKLEGQVDGISVSVGSPEPIEQINYTIRDDDGEPVYNGSEEFDEPTEHYQVVVGDNATANDSEAAGDDTITVSGNETDPLTDRVDEPSLEYSGQYANGTLFEGSTDFDGILGNDSGSIGFGPTGGSGGGGGGSPIVGVALVGGVGYAAYRVTGNGKGIRQAARKVVGRFR